VTILDALPKISEQRFLRQLIGSMNPRTGRRDGGLLRMLGWELIFHDEATNAPRACPKCKAEIHLPRNEPGFLDIWAVRGDTLAVIELKSARGKLSEAQERWYTALRAVKRVKVALYRPDDTERILEALR
jgi:hypothetical protein